MQKFSMFYLPHDAQYIARIIIKVDNNTLLIEWYISNNQITLISTLVVLMSDNRTARRGWENDITGGSRRERNSDSGGKIDAKSEREMKTSKINKAQSALFASLPYEKFLRKSFGLKLKENSKLTHMKKWVIQNWTLQTNGEILFDRFVCNFSVFYTN